MESTNKRTMSAQDFDVTTKQSIELKLPGKKQKVVITITKRHYYDPIKKKIVTDQVVHRAKFRIGKKMKKRRENE